MRKTIIFSISFLLFISLGEAQAFSRKIPQSHKHRNIKHSKSLKQKYFSIKNSILEESFEAGIPSDWLLYTIGDPSGWTITTEQAHTGTSAAYHEDTDALCDNWIVSPQLSIDNAGYFFKVWQYELYSAYYETHEIVISTGSGDPNDGDFTNVIYEGAGTEEAWEEIVVSLAEYVGQDIYIGFHYIGEYADQWTIDDVSVASASIHDLGITEINFTSTILYFENTAIISIHNYASSEETSFQMNIAIEDDNAQTIFDENETINYIAPNQTIEVQIPLPEFEEVGEYTITASIILADDENPDNNTLSGSFEVLNQGWFLPELDSPIDQYLGSSAIDPDNMNFYCIGGNPDGVKVSVFDYD